MHYSLPHTHTFTAHAHANNNRKKRMFCSNCQKFNHNTADCWKNKSKRQKKTGSNSNNDKQDEDEDLQVLPTSQKGVVKAAL